MNTISHKRLVMTAGDARVGKSTTARLLLELYLESKIKLRAYYTGDRNKLFSYEPLLIVSELPLTRGGGDKLLIDLERFSEIQLALSDLPGQNLQQFKRFASEVQLWDAIASIDYRITFVHPISDRRDCIEYLQELFDYCGDEADYVIVKNLLFDEEFPYFDGTDIQKCIQEVGGEELYLGALWKGTYELVEAMNYPYCQAIESEEIDSLNRSRIFNWREEFHQQIKNNATISNLLGLAPPTPVENLQPQLLVDF
ncbi:MAG: hypothetical protein PUP93_34630 [Rhizonema sp. NSF051]|nr:hypothetical protein [Rhizonema sp. NSF051]